MRCLEQRYNKYSRYSDSGKSNICDKYTGYSAYARCLGHPSIRSPAVILSSVHRPIHRTDSTVTGQLTGAIFTQSVSPQSHESPPVQSAWSLSDARAHSASVRVTSQPVTLRKESLGLKSVVWNFRWGDYFWQLSSWDCQPGFRNLLFLVYESYEISRCRNQILRDYYKIRNS